MGGFKPLAGATHDLCALLPHHEDSALGGLLSVYWYLFYSASEYSRACTATLSSVSLVSSLSGPHSVRIFSIAGSF